MQVSITGNKGFAANVDRENPFSVQLWKYWQRHGRLRAVICLEKVLKILLFLAGLNNFLSLWPSASGFSYITVIRINELSFDPLQCLWYINPTYKITQVLHLIPSSAEHLNVYFETRFKGMFEKKHFLMALVNWGLHGLSRWLLEESTS